MFNNPRYITSGIAEKIPLHLQALMWELIDNLSIEKDYLQVFTFSECGGKLKLTHRQECPEYLREYLIADTPAFNAKIYVIDSIDYSCMLLNYEY